MTNALDEISAQMKLMRAFIEATVEMQEDFRKLDDILNTLKGNSKSLGDSIARIKDESERVWELENLRLDIERNRVKGRTILEEKALQVGLLEAPLLSEEFDCIAKKIICAQTRLPQDLRGKLAERLTAWISELGNVEDIDSINFEDPRLSRVVALINLKDFQKACLDTFKRSRLQWLAKLAWRDHPNACLMTQEHRPLMDLLSHVQSRLKEEITALGYIFHGIDKEYLSPVYRAYLDALLKSTCDELENITDQINGYRSIVFAIFGASYFNFSLAQVILPEVSDQLMRFYQRVNSLLMNKLNDLADYLREDLVDALGTLQHDCVSPPEHEALENARFLLAAISEAYESSAPFDAIEEARSSLEEIVVAKLSQAITSLSQHLSGEQSLIFKLNAFAKLRGPAFSGSLESLFEIEGLLQKICELDLQKYFVEAKVPISVPGSMAQLNAHDILLESEHVADQLLWQLYRCASSQPEQGLYQHASNIEDLRLKRRAKELIRETISRVYEGLLDISDKTLPRDGPAPPGLDQFRMLIYS